MEVATLAQVVQTPGLVPRLIPSVFARIFCTASDRTWGISLGTRLVLISSCDNNGNGQLLSLQTLTSASEIKLWYERLRNGLFRLHRKNFIWKKLSNSRPVKYSRYAIIVESSMHVCECVSVWCMYVSGKEGGGGGGGGEEKKRKEKGTLIPSMKILYHMQHLSALQAYELQLSNLTLALSKLEAALRQEQEEKVPLSRGQAFTLEV